MNFFASSSHTWNPPVLCRLLDVCLIFTAGATEPCKPCPEGKICHLAGMEHPVTCPAGTRHFNADPSGTEPAEYPQDRQENVVYQGPNTMASSLMACTKCAAGTYCQGGGATSQKCPDRHFCPEGTETPVHCPPGTTTKAGVGAKGESDCTPCPPGFACNSGKEEQCEAGYYCPEGTRYKHEFPCPGGTYSGQGKAKCTSCPAGRYCPPASTTPKNCPAGYYCLAGSDNPWNTPCPVNTFSARPNLTREQECLKCRKNEYCPVATVDPLPCPQEKLDPALGIECSLVALKRCQVGEYLGSSSCLACKPGYYCGSAGMSEEDMLDHPCPAGYTCPTPGLSSGTATKCPAGSYCLTGTSDAQGILCRPGTYNDELGAASAEECQPLPAGVYSGGGAKTAAGDGKCDAGYYCPEGSTVPHAVPCPRGTYLNQPGGQREEDCLPCAPGTYCDTVAETQPLSCPAGHYCLGGTHLPVPCPVGTFRTDPDGDSLEACTACPAGKYCPLLGAVEDAGDCEAGYLCIRGATVSTPTDGVTGSLCPLGYYCGSGAQQPESCPQGAYIPFAGSTSQDDCISCKPGFYCDGSDKANPLKPCSAGSYCTGGARTGTQHPVPEGHYSPAGSSGPVACLPGTFQNERSQAQCKPCTEGYYCPELGMSQPTECGAGRYCPAGSSAPLLCPPGTFSSAATASVVSECAACTAGHYCSGPGASVETGKCAPGYFCKSGSRSPTPEDATENFGPCPAGTYCDVGTHTPTPCNAGTYGPSPRAVDEKACVPCDAGSFCDQPGLTKPVGPCGEGYYCEAGSDSATPTGKECPAGKKCPGGSPAPSPCQPGTYQSQQGQSTCVECSAGSYCGVAATGETPCPAGSFCPPGTKHGQENLCPPGTFRANTGATSLSDCTPCGEGDFCGDFGLTQASGKCKAGFYCKQYNIVSQPLTSDCYFAAPVRGGQTTTCHNTIPAGFTSKVDAFEACSASEDCEGVVKTVDGRFHLRCGVYTAAGEYRDTIFYWRICWEGGRCGPGELCAAGASEPVACPVGHYCQATAASQEQGPCPAGYLCPDGSLNTMEAASLCPKGHFCVNGIAEACPEGKYLPARGGRSEKECLDCPAGFYCSGTGKEEPTGTCDPGYFCAKGANSAQHAACPGGHYCPRGAVEAIPCPAGTVQPDSGQESCLPCSTGNYCEFGATEGKPCPAGYYCPSASGTGTSFPCPIGTFSAQEGVTSADTCTKCLAGHFCDVPGLTKPVGKCLPGYYCPVGTGLRYPKTFCPPGSYCPRGSFQPTDCPANYYCDTSRLSEPTAACSPGFICGARSTTPTPTQAISGSACSENLQGYKCPAGYYCPPALTRLVAGVGYPGKSAEGVDASKAFLNGPQDAVRTSNGDIFIADTGNQRVARLDAVTGEVTTYIGQGLRQGDSSWILTAKPTRLALSPNQETLYILYSDVARVVQHTLSNAKTTEVVDARGCSSPQGFAVDPTGSALYIADTGNNRIRKVPVAPPSRATDLFGQAQTDTADNPPDQGPKLDRPSAVWVSSNGVVYIADAGNGRIRRFQQAAGPQSGAQLTTIVGGPVAGVKLESPVALTGFEAGGKVFLVAYDAGVQMVLKIDTSESTPTKVDLFDASRAGNGHVDSQIQSRFGSVQMETPTGDTVAVLFGDPERHRIRRIFLNPDYEEPVGKKVPCPAGTYLDYDGAYAESHCKECPAGKYCRGTGLTQPTGDCAGGFTCDARSEQPEGTPCPVGHFCPASSELPSKVAQPCPPGTYQDEQRQTACKQCPAGQFCSSFKTETPTPCPEGHYCPPGTVSPHLFPCPLGTFSNKQGVARVDECQPCPAGSYCASRGLTRPTGLCDAGHLCTGKSWLAAPTVTSVNPDIVVMEEGQPRLFSGFGMLCPVGFYCLEGAQRPSECPAGRQTAAAGAMREEECVPCEPGFYCPEPGVSLPCDAGYVCLEGATMATPADTTTGKQCDAGFYCPQGSFRMLPCRPGTTSAEGASSCTPCEAGNFCPWPGTPSGDADGIKQCPAGHACPAGSSRPIPCPVGTFQNDAGAEECNPCPEGFYCGEGGLTAATKKCFVGFVCGMGASTPSDWDNVYGVDGASSGRCPKGHKCSTEGGLPVACEPGTYQDSTASTECKICPPGKFCSTAGLHEPSGDCEGGFFCKAGAKTARPATEAEGGGICPVGWVCPQGSAAPQGCPPGQYTDRRGQETCQLCPAGKFCLKAGDPPQVCTSGHVCDAGSGVGNLCPAGSYFKISSEATTKGSCFPCTVGHYCRAGQIAGPCAPGFLCGLGNWLPNPNADYKPPTPFIPQSESFSAVLLTLENWRQLEAGAALYGGIPCPAGHYCVAGATAPAACGRNTARLETGGRWKNDCSPCPAGYFCKDDEPVPYPCPRGYYCPFASRDPTPCPQGTLSSREKAESLGDCVSCPSGYHCNAGTSDLADDGLLCPAGYYCPEGTKDPVPCMPGTYNAFTGGTSVDSCLPCPAGFFCSSEGTARPTTTCPAGYYCPAGSMSPVICPPSSYCPLQSSAPKACAKAGFYCPLGTPSPEPCPSGAVCVVGATEPALCPKGTYLPPSAPGVVGGSEQECITCPLGSFTDSFGSTSCSICSPGFLCYEGCSSSRPASKETDKGRPCPLGHYCLPGALEASPCPAGTAGMKEGLRAEEDCTLCQAGTFNELPGQSTCSMCGASSTSDPGSLTCNCKGENRMFQPSDKSCVCKPGFVFLKNGVDMASEDGEGNCYQVVHDRCGVGESRDASGECVDPSSTCVKHCGEGGGEFNEVAGLCMCFSSPSQIAECDLTCQRHAPRMLLSDDKFIVEETQSSGDVHTLAEIPLASLRPNRLAGTPTCTPGERCSVQLQDMTTGNSRTNVDTAKKSPHLSRGHFVSSECLPVF
ncbi:GCC2 and GCC3 domain-containing protein [Toxoplasma gondii VAND]|uniref:GCC2 and GCC3 domain-containing protein n=1 Tax=Toxoplasma gondii VAND TaxID=933077 RepID=A0A086PZE7_TOXGO|nr:GCC2 and GCC3 domain-containing protein [Toxoplasma gondii VAND]